jgi:hypothetical protein
MLGSIQEPGRMLELHCRQATLRLHGTFPFPPTRTSMVALTLLNMTYQVNPTACGLDLK